MKSILFLSSIFPRSYDRTRGIYCYHVCKAMSLEHSVTVVSPRSWFEAITHRSPYLPPDMTGSLSVHYPTYIQPPIIARHLSDRFMWLSIRHKIVRIVEEIRPDCVISYWAHPDGAVAVRAAQTTGVPVGIIVGGSDILILPRNSRRKAVIAKTLNDATAVFAVSRDLQEKTISLGVAPSKVHLVYQGVDSVFTPGSRLDARIRLGLNTQVPILLWVGRMDPIKGLEVLLQACANLKSSGMAFQLYLVGDGPIRRIVESDINRLQLSNCIHLAGNVAHDQLPDWYRAANVTVLSSHSEGIPNVLRESLACGTPYVATRVGGISELSDHSDNILVSPGNPSALAEAIRRSISRCDSKIEPHKIGTWEDYARTVLDVIFPHTSVFPMNPGPN